MRNPRYFGIFSNYQEMMDEWENANVKEEEVVFASYDISMYEGEAICVFVRDGKIYEANDYHCSCGGLENWEEEETSIGALLLRPMWNSLQREFVKNAAKLLTEVGSK